LVSQGDYTGKFRVLKTQIPKAQPGEAGTNQTNQPRIDANNRDYRPDALIPFATIRVYSRLKIITIWSILNGSAAVFMNYSSQFS
jgi:hypothetical protein